MCSVCAAPRIQVEWKQAHSMDGKDEADAVLERRVYGGGAYQVTSSEFIAEVEGWLEVNQRRIDEKIAAGARFLRARKSGLVHALGCPSIRGQLDLRSVEPFSLGLSIEKLQYELTHGGWPLLPELETAEQINARGGARCCRTCSPEVIEKAPGGSRTRAGTVNCSHIGRAINGKVVEWVRIESSRIVLGLEDGSSEPYGLDDRIAFDKKNRDPALGV